MDRVGRWLLDHIDAQERDLFPALVESMAGSDAICLRELTAGCTREHRALEAALRRAGDVPADSPTRPFERLRNLCEQHLAREETELLPMAARLLGDDEVARFRQPVAT